VADAGEAYAHIVSSPSERYSLLSVISLSLLFGFVRLRHFSVHEHIVYRIVRAY